MFQKDGLCYNFSMDMPSEKQLQRTLDELFWGDYLIDLQTAKQKISCNDQYFLRFLVSRIVSHSLSPACRLLALFSRDDALRLLSSIKVTGPAQRRRSLAQAIIAGTVWEEEPQWLRKPIL